MSSVYAGRSLPHTVPGILSANSLEPGTLIPYCRWCLKCGDWQIGNELCVYRALITAYGTGTWYPKRQLFGTRNAHTLLQLVSEVRGLANKKRWRPERQSFHTGWFLLAAALNDLSYWSNVS
jgi:hypothetical protein